MFPNRAACRKTTRLCSVVFLDKYILIVLKKIRYQKKRCPWDKKQTMESIIIPHTIEEVYKVAEQIYHKITQSLKKN